MAKVTITLEDVDGEIAMSANFGEHFDFTSNAHQHAKILIDKMDEMAQRQSHAVSQPLVQLGQGRAQ